MKLFTSCIVVLLAAVCLVPPCCSDNPSTDWSTFSSYDLRKTAEGGNADAQWYLGHCYCTGRKVEQNLVAAFQWFWKAAEKNNCEAQHLVGWCYGRGKVVMKDDVEAVKWYRKAAEKNHREAVYQLGLCYHLGNGVRKDDVEAVKLFRKAADQNSSRAQFWLGVCYLDGLGGLTKDIVEGYKWILLSAMAENPFAKRRIPMTESLLTPEQIAKGKELAREFAAAHPQPRAPIVQQLPGFPSIEAILEASPTNHRPQPTQQASVSPPPQPTPAATTAIPPPANSSAGLLLSSSKASKSLAGSIWVGADSRGKVCEYRFQKDGSLHYMIPADEVTMWDKTELRTDGTWKQEGDAIHMQVCRNSADSPFAAELKGQIAGTRMAGKLVDVAGKQWGWEAEFRRVEDKRDITSTASQGLALSTEWNKFLEKGSIVLGELQRLLSDCGRAAVDLQPHPEIFIYNDIHYLDPYRDVCRKFGKTEFSAPVQLGCPGFPEKSLYYYAFDGMFDAGFTRLLIVTDLRKQVVAIEFTEDAVKSGSKIPPRGNNGWKVQDFVRLRMKGITSWDVFHEVWKRPTDGSNIRSDSTSTARTWTIDSSLVDSGDNTDLRSSKSNTNLRSGKNSQKGGEGDVRQRTRLLLPQPIVNLILFRLSGQKYQPPPASDPTP